MTNNGDNTPSTNWNPEALFPTDIGKFLKWGLFALAGLITLALIYVLLEIYTNWLWFESLGFLGIFRTVLWTKIWLFLGGTLIFGVLAGASAFIAYRNGRGESYLPLPPETIYSINKLVVAIIVLVVAIASLAFGASLSTNWESVLRLSESSQFGILDPVFQKDVSFFIFTLPVLNLVQGWILGAFIATLIITVGIFLIQFGIRGVPIQISQSQKTHAAVIGALIFLTLAAGHLLGRYQTLLSEGGAVFGATYTDIHARIPALIVLAFVTASSGIILLASLHPSIRGPRGNRLTIAAVSLWLIATLGVGNLYPSFVQRFSVDPNELQKERTYIERNIEFTRAAFGINNIDNRAYEATGQLTSKEILNNSETVNNVRLWDPKPLVDTYNQIQHLRLYYNFSDADVDRYEVDGEYRQVLVGAREIHPELLPEEAQRWVNQKLQFTHGYGAAASPVTEFTDEGRPIFFVKDVPPTGTLKIDRPEIYYGENTKDYVIVNSETPEFDHPTEDNTPVYVQYKGNGGITLSSLLRRLAYALHFRDVNVLISGEITTESKVMYEREVSSRIAKIAPFLTLDNDPYMVIENGRLVWIQDAYTTTNKYPYSKPVGNFNYIRNSVKVVVDAYHGGLKFYIANPDDPIIQTYKKIFPDLFLPMSQMSDFLKDHLRYPEDMFSIQAETYLQYHMTDPTVFFNKEDQWSIPSEISFGKQQPVEPYYVIMKLPGEKEVEFVLILPFTPADKPNMVAWLASRMDRPHYGELVAYTFPSGVQVDGPVQIEARIDNDTEISQQFTLWDQSGSAVIRGNLLVIPIADSILYVEPIYLMADGVPLPELKRVILASANKVVMEETLDDALKELFGTQISLTQTPSDEKTTDPSGNVSNEIGAIKEALSTLRKGLLTLDELVAKLSDEVNKESKS